VVNTHLNTGRVDPDSSLRGGCNPRRWDQIKEIVTRVDPRGARCVTATRPSFSSSARPATFVILHPHRGGMLTTRPMREGFDRGSTRRERFVIAIKTATLTMGPLLLLLGRCCFARTPTRTRTPSPR
jgi:hypothetical protein